MGGVAKTSRQVDTLEMSTRSIVLLALCISCYSVCASEDAFEDYDTNHDGVIDYDEFSAINTLVEDLVAPKSDCKGQGAIACCSACQKPTLTFTLVASPCSKCKDLYAHCPANSKSACMPPCPTGGRRLLGGCHKSDKEDKPVQNKLPAKPPTSTTVPDKVPAKVVPNKPSTTVPPKVPAT